MLKILKSVFLIIIISINIFSYNIKITNSEENSKSVSFIVTAYYSPLPNQKAYITGTYIGDKILNGEGHTTASGKPIKSGILAAPNKYPFGTKIYFENYGIGVVEDRGGAIVKAGVRGHEHDRIDIWMGYGDEGLQRALKWGKKTLDAKIVSRTENINLKFADNILSGLENIKVNPQTHKKEDVIKLQKKFKELGLYNGDIDGKYNSIQKSLIDFQVKYNVIKSKNQIDAGWFGPKTYTTLLKNFTSDDVLIKQKINIQSTINPKVDIILEAPEIRLNGDEPQKEEVIKVQKLFKKLGMYSGKIDGNFGKIKRILLDFQKQAGIIKKDNDWGAGYFGEKTKAALIIYFENNTNYKKKKITINDINYRTLRLIAIKLKKFKTKDKIITKLEKSVQSIKNTNIKNKIKFLIKEMKK